MFFLKNLIPAVLTTLFGLLLLAGCASREIKTRYFDSSRKADSETMRKRAEEFRTATVSLALSGVALHPELMTVDDDADPDALVARLRGFGFNHVYYHIPLKSDLDGRLENFLAAAGRARLPVDLVIRQDAYFRVFRGGSLVRPLIPEKTTLPEMAEKIVDFNDGLPETDRIAGLTVVVAPHEFTTANVNRPKHLMYAWSPKTFGPGLDNDMLMKYTFNQLREIAVLLGDLPLTVGVPDFYHQLAAEGKISVG